MRDEDIHIGDTLRIRSYEDMKSEFGVDLFGRIHGTDNDPRVEVMFEKDMIGLCGSVFTVSQKSIYHSAYEYRSVEGVENCEDGGIWVIRAWMLEPHEEDAEWEVADDDQIALLLS